MNKIRKFGWIYIITVVCYFTFQTFHFMFLQFLYNPVIGYFILSMANFVSILFIITIIMLFLQKVKMVKIFGSINSLFISMIIILTIILDCFTYLGFFDLMLIIVDIVIVLMGILSCFIIIRVLSLKEGEAEEFIVKKTILDLSTKFTRLKVEEIGEKCEVNAPTIVKVIKDMIKNKEIYADYFKSSQTVAFDQQRNVEEIDELMRIFKEWEEKKVEKGE